MSGPRKQSREGNARCPAEAPEGKRQTNLCIEISPCVPFGHLVEMTMSISKIIYPTVTLCAPPPLSKGRPSGKLLCNAISDERGKPRVISCAARNVAAYAAINPWRCEQLFFTAYHAQHGFREASKTRRTRICPQGAYTEVRDQGKTQVQHSIAQLI